MHYAAVNDSCKIVMQTTLLNINCSFSEHYYKTEDGNTSNMYDKLCSKEMNALHKECSEVVKGGPIFGVNAQNCGSWASDLGRPGLGPPFWCKSGLCNMDQFCVTDEEQEENGG